uniref:Peptidase A1 domain-containing protein n=1 Tax=Acrobeloides nanus TaxID=290746 RepID=A0A914E2G5_9BILA
MKLLWTLILLGLTSAAPTKQIIQSTIGATEPGLFVVNVTIGTPKQQFIVQLSIQNNGLYIQDKSCSNYCNHTFDSSKSSTYRFVSQNTSGDYNYTIGQDIVNLGLSPNLLPIPNTIFEQDTISYYADGVLGLGLGNTGGLGLIGNNLPILVNAYNQGVVDQPIYTIYVRKNIQNGDAGVITYGGVDSTNCGSMIAYQPLANYENYIIEFSDISYGSYANSSTYTTIVDSTYDGISGPASVIDSMAKVVGATPNQIYYYQVDCDKKLPSFTFMIGGKQYTIDSNHQIGAKNTKFPLTNMCEWKFFRYSEDGLWMFGGPFAKSYCNIYDPGNKRVGFALPKDSFSTISTTHGTQGVDQNTVTHGTHGVDQNTVTHRTQGVDQNTVTHRTQGVDQNTVTYGTHGVDQNTVTPSTQGADQTSRNSIVLLSILFIFLNFI